MGGIFQVLEEAKSDALEVECEPGDLSAAQWVVRPDVARRVAY